MKDMECEKRILNMKQISKSLLIAVIIPAMFAVSCKDEGRPVISKTFTVVASFYPVYIIVKNVADSVEGVRVVNLTPPVTGCLHDYSITAADMRNLEGAGILLVNGAGMESFLGKINERYPGLRVAELSRGIKLIEVNGSKNPHVWLSISNAIVMTLNCVDALAAADRVHEAQYRANGNKYIAKLMKLRGEMDSGMKPYSGKRIITFHEAFPYFAQEYGLVIAAVIEREPGSEPSARELAETIMLIKKSGIRSLFIEPQYPSTTAGTIAAETGAGVYILDPAVTGEDSNDAYINIMRKNLDVLESAFK